MSDLSSLHICIVGLGLIGASLAKALRANGFSGTLSAWVRSEQTLNTARSQQVVDIVSTQVDVAAEADIVLLAVPMGVMRTQMSALNKVIRTDTIVTDAGSVKGCFVADAKAVFGSLSRVVPGHPIAGRETSGIDAAEAELFQSRMVLLTPTEETDADAVELVRQLWTTAGAKVEMLGYEEHDRILAATSHLPHAIAFALVDNLAHAAYSEGIFRYAAGGFRDFTRVASGDPTMWRDICLTNGPAMLEVMDAFSDHFSLLRNAIEKGDAEAIMAIFERAKEARDDHVHHW